MTKPSVVYLECTSEQKTDWERKAKERGLFLSQWIRVVLDMSDIRIGLRLPVDDEMDRRATIALNKHARSRRTRKL